MSKKKGRSAPAALSKRPDTSEIAVAQVQDKFSDYPSNGLTPQRLAAIFREADAGDVFRQMELFEEMEEKDPHLFSQLQTRKNAVTGLDYEVIPFSDDDGDKTIAEFVADEINSIENFEDVEMDLLDAIGKGFAVSEIIWDYQDGKTTAADIRSRQQKRFFWDPIDDSFKVRTKEYPSGIVVPENKFIVHRYKARSGHPSRAGVLRVVAWMYLFKNYDVKDWVSFCEVYGMPLRLGKYAQGASDDDKDALMQALVKIGTDAAGIIPDGTSIDFHEANKSTSIDVYDRLARYCDEQVSKAILGQTLTSDSGGGSYAQSKTHNEVRHDLTVADCKALAATLRRDLIRPLALFNFGDDSRLPSIRFDCKEAEDLKDVAEVLGTLIQQTGLKVPTSYLYKKFSIPEPKDGEPVATPPAAAAPVMPTPFKAPTVRMPLKDSHQEPDAQAQVDGLADKAVSRNAGTFQGMLAPVLKLLEQSGSLDELKEKLSDEKAVEALLASMDAPKLEALLQRAMILADMKGRAVESG